MPCINPECRQEVGPDDPFCPYCGTSQTLSSPVQEKEGEKASPITPSIIKPPIPLSQSKKPDPRYKSGEVLVMRASENIWHFIEEEKETKPGQRRPLLILDEESTHLSHTDRRLEPEELFERVAHIIDRYEVPVEVSLIQARWLGDEREIRPRLVASLTNHSFSDIKMILGVDYLGKWASIHLCVGTEPEPVKPAWKMPKEVLMILAAGAVAFFIGMAINRGELLFVGFLGGAIGAWLAWKSYKKSKINQAKEALKRVTERLARTFKYDDIRLFSSAMRVVYKAVVDDIVSMGAKVMRIEGGKGGLFEQEAKEPGAPRKKDAATVEV
jgi:hypothetical protein